MEREVGIYVKGRREKVRKEGRKEGRKGDSKKKTER